MRKRVNLSLAVIYGLLMFLAIGNGCFLMSVDMKLSLMDHPPRPQSEVFSYPWAIVGAGHTLYISELFEIVRGDGRETFQILHFNDGSGWRKGLNLEKSAKLYPWGDGLLAIEEDKFLVIQGDRVIKEIPYGVPAPYLAVNYQEGLALISRVTSRIINLTYLDRAFVEKWNREIEVPEKIGGRGSCLGFRVAATEELLWLLWQDDKTLYYAPLKENGLGEVKKARFKVDYYYLAAIPGRAVIAVELPRRGPGRILPIKELRKDGKWQSLPALFFPEWPRGRIILTEYQGELTALIGDVFEPSIKKLHQGKWVESKQIPPLLKRARNLEIGKLAAIMFKAMIKSMVWLIILPTVLVFVAHFHFRFRKPLQFKMGEQQVCLASLSRRTLAFIVDSALSSIPAIALGWTTLEKLISLEDPAGFPSLMTLGMAAVVAGIIIPPFYFFLTEFLWGKGIGKALFGIRVVMTNGEPCTPAAAAVRNLLRLIEGLFYYLPALIAVAASEKYQRIGDLAAKTIVVREDRSKDVFSTEQ